jgi:hypothetical protein
LDPIERLNNVARSNFSSFGDGGAYYNSVSPPDDQYTKAVYSSANGSTNNGGPLARVSTSASTFYFARFDVGNGNAKLFKRVAGTYTQLTSGVSGDWCALVAGRAEGRAHAHRGALVG